MNETSSVVLLTTNLTLRYQLQLCIAVWGLFLITLLLMLMLWVWLKNVHEAGYAFFWLIYATSWAVWKLDLISLSCIFILPYARKFRKLRVLRLHRTGRNYCHNVVGTCFVFMGVGRQADLGERYIVDSSAVCLQTVTQNSHALFRFPCAPVWQAVDGWRATPNPRRATHPPSTDIVHCSTVFDGVALLTKTNMNSSSYTKGVVTDSTQLLYFLSAAF